MSVYNKFTDNETTITDVKERDTKDFADSVRKKYAIEGPTVPSEATSKAHYKAVAEIHFFRASAALTIIQDKAEDVATLEEDLVQAQEQRDRLREELKELRKLKARADGEIRQLKACEIPSYRSENRSLKGYVASLERELGRPGLTVAPPTISEDSPSELAI